MWPHSEVTSELLKSLTPGHLADRLSQVGAQVGIFKILLQQILSLLSGFSKNKAHPTLISSRKPSLLESEVWYTSFFFSFLTIFPHLAPFQHLDLAKKKSSERVPDSLIWSWLHTQPWPFYLDFHLLMLREIICFLLQTSLVAQKIKASVYNAGDLGSIPRSGRSPWRRKWQPTPVLLPGKSDGWRSLVGNSPWGHKESDTIEQLHFTSGNMPRSGIAGSWWFYSQFFKEPPYYLPQ